MSEVASPPARWWRIALVAALGALVAATATWFLAQPAEPEVRSLGASRTAKEAVASLQEADLTTRAYGEVVAAASYLQSLGTFGDPVPEELQAHTAAGVSAIEERFDAETRVEAVAVMSDRLGSTATELRDEDVELPAAANAVLAPLTPEQLAGLRAGSARLDPGPWAAALDELQDEALARRAEASESSAAVEELGGGSARRIAVAAAAAALAALVFGGATTLWLLRSNRALRRSTLVDPLTGVANRRALDEIVAVGDRPTAVLMIDVDHFKDVNDRLGHHAGDEALRRVASTLTEALRDGDVLFRYGGEEFCAVLADLYEEDADAVADRLRVAVETMELPGAEELRGGRLTVSVGVSRRGNVAAALRAADGAVYEAKRSGRNCVMSAEEPVAS